MHARRTVGLEDQEGSVQNIMNFGMKTAQYNNVIRLMAKLLTPAGLHFHELLHYMLLVLSNIH